MGKLALLLATAALAASAPARAGDSPQAPPPPEEQVADPWWPWAPPDEEEPEEEPPPAAPAHQGLYVRLDGGFGYAGSAAYPTPESTVSQAWLEAPSGLLGASIGGAVGGDMILAAEVWGMAYVGPRFQPPRPSVTPGGAWLYGAGLQVTWYWQPANIYLSFTPSLSLLQLQLDGRWYRSQLGFAVKSSFGWEWPIAPRWGVGPAVQLLLGTNQNDAGQSSIEWFSFGIGLAFSITYN